MTCCVRFFSVRFAHHLSPTHGSFVETAGSTRAAICDTALIYGRITVQVPRGSQKPFLTRIRTSRRCWWYRKHDRQSTSRRIAWLNAFTAAYSQHDLATATSRRCSFVPNKTSFSRPVLSGRSTQRELVSEAGLGREALELSFPANTCPLKPRPLTYSAADGESSVLGTAWSAVDALFQTSKPPLQFFTNCCSAC